MHQITAQFCVCLSKILRIDRKLVFLPDILQPAFFIAVFFTVPIHIKVVKTGKRIPFLALPEPLLGISDFAQTDQGKTPEMIYYAHRYRRRKEMFSLQPLLHQDGIHLQFNL